MSVYRLAGAVAAAALLILLVVVAVSWSRYTGLVRPTVAVVPDVVSEAPRSGSVTQARPEVAQILAARTRMQADETNKAVTSQYPLTGNEKLDFAQAKGGDANLVREWQKQADPQGVATRSEFVSGTTSLPYRNMQVLEQPEGREWRAQHGSSIRFGGASFVFGAALAIALFLFARGRILIAERRSGQTVERFNIWERSNHWMTATAFMVMALTGLVILYGKPLLLPLIGGPALGKLAWWSAWLHMGAAVPFMLGIVMMVVFWLRENFITRLDVEWLKRFGGFLHDDPDKPSARRFNAGQKLVFWGVVLGGLAALLTGMQLMLPFEWLGYDGMQWAQLLHAAIGLGMVALILGHIYIGSVGMEGAIDAMWSGRVDRNWAKEHHDLWYEELEGGARPRSSPQRKS